MIYQHPLAYLLGIEGLALLRAWAGDYDEAFVTARLAEVRRLLDEPALAERAGVAVRRGDLASAYRAWSATYDEPRNACSTPTSRSCTRSSTGCRPGPLSTRPAAPADTRRTWPSAGTTFVGVDGSAEMLDRARTRVASGTFARADLHRLPLAEDAVDLVVCGLALVHVPSLAVVLAEFARVLRRGGHLVISDVHHELVLRGSVVHAPGPAGEPGLSPSYRHTAGDYLRAALPHGLRVRRCEEPRREMPAQPPPAELSPGDWADWPWTLLPLAPEASRAAWDQPSTIIWHFQLDDR